LILTLTIDTQSHITLWDKQCRCKFYEQDRHDFGRLKSYRNVITQLWEYERPQTIQLNTLTHLYRT